MSKAFDAIVAHYGMKCSKRGNVPLILHIMQGLHILREIGAKPAVQDAYCLHPMFQADEDFKANWRILLDYEPRVVLYVMEYRRTANAFLRGMPQPEKLRSPLDEVNAMLIADKVQNRYSFEKYHKGIHPESDALAAYFDVWLDALGVLEAEYLQWAHEFNEVVDAGVC